jgi:ESX secretion-associated protein EspC/F
MPGDDLRITTAHLADLAAKQAEAAFQTRSATFAVEGVDVAVRGTHGSIATAAADAVEAVLIARRGAGAKMAEISDDLGHKLADAARRYTEIDNALGEALDEQVQTG